VTEVQSRITGYRVAYDYVRARVRSCKCVCRSMAGQASGHGRTGEVRVVMVDAAQWWRAGGRPM
jgi:hypothetical protein